MILKSKVIYVGQLEGQNENKINTRFFESEKENKRVIDVSEGDPKSFIVTDEHVYFSLISASTLEKRLRANVVS